MKKLRLVRGDNIDAALDSLGVADGDSFTITVRGCSYDPGGLDTDHVVEGIKGASNDAARLIFPHSGTARRKVIEALVDGRATRDELVDPASSRP